MNRPLAIGLLGATLAAAACGGGGGATVSPISGWRAFDVVATLTLTPPSSASESFKDFPVSHAFTLALNAESRHGIVGAGGSVGDFLPTSADGANFQTRQLVPLPLAFAGGCAGVAHVQYDDVTFSIVGDTLVGTAHGHARFQSGDQIFEAEVAAALTGVSDATPPRLLGTASPVDPLAGFRIAPSEPISNPVLPVQPALVGEASGDVVPLPLAQSPGFFVNGFSTERVLRYGETYSVQVDDLIDFAGHAAVAAPPSFVTQPVPPLAPEDGFESVTTPTFGGAGVLRGEPLTPIAGTTSLILNTGVGGGFGFLPYMLGPSLTVRLTVPPGKKTLRFERRLITTYDLPSVAYEGSVRLGSVGRGRVEAAQIKADGLQKLTLPLDGDVYVSGVATVFIPIPEDAADELVFEIAGTLAGCGGVPPPPTALIVDDLRLE